VNVQILFKERAMIGKNMNGFAIPRRAFVEDTQRNEFIQLCEQYIQVARRG
jgi:hypothetical protein